MKIGLIGFGAFGQFFAKLLSKKANIAVTDVTDKSGAAGKLGLKFVSLDEALHNELIILAVPMASLESTLKTIKNKLRKGTLVMDVCSSKMFSCKLMDKILPKDVEIIGTHPLFGPQTGNCPGLKIALCNVRSRRMNEIKNFFSSLSVTPVVTTAEEHDKEMAVSQNMVHFIGKACENAGLKRVSLSTKSFDVLMDIVDVVKQDSPALIRDMHRMNPYSLSARKKFIKEAEKLDKKFS